MEEPKFYDGVKLLSLKDINGKTPEIFMSTSNRNAGKTTYYNRWVMNRFLKHDEKFIILVRFSYELDEIEDRFFKDIRTLFFPQFTMTSKGMVNNKFRELFIAPNDQEELERSCGYAIALNDADLIKKYSHYFSDAERIIFDEFQSESNHYCSDEVTKFQSIHKSLARGQGKQVRYLPVIMIANMVSLLNPYYVALKISSRINEQTKYLKGKGFVLECHYNESATKSAEESGFVQAFEDSDYTNYSTQNVYLNDNKAFIEKLEGRSKYMCTIKYMNKEYAIRMFEDKGILYCDDRVDSSFKSKISITTDDHNINYVMLKNNDIFIANLRYYFNHGCFRFKDLQCKEAVLSMLSY